MKKIAIFSSIVIMLLAQSSCSFDKLKADILNIKENTEEKVDNVKKEVERINTEISDTTAVVKDKYEKGKKVVEAINDFTKSE